MSISAEKYQLNLDASVNLALCEIQWVFVHWFKQDIQEQMKLPLTKVQKLHPDKQPRPRQVCLFITIFSSDNH
jgi:hypothetical protein